eukprot:Rmarinus@m.12086
MFGGLMYNPEQWLSFIGASVFTMFIAVFLHFAAELVNPTMYVPVASTAFLLYLTIPFTYGMGGKLRYKKSWRFFQPFFGGAAFIVLQALSWGFFAAAILQSVVLPLLPQYSDLHGWDLSFIPTSRGFALSSGIAAFLSEVLMVSSLMCFREPRRRGSGLHLKGHDNDTSFISTLPGTIWVNIFIGLNMVLALFACFLTMVRTENNFQTALNLLLSSWCLGAAVPLTHFLGGLWRNRNRNWKSWQPFQGGKTFITLQIFAWGLYAISLLCTIYLLFTYFAPLLYGASDPVTPSFLQNVRSSLSQIEDVHSGIQVGAGVTGVLSEVLMLASLVAFDGPPSSAADDDSADDSRLTVAGLWKLALTRLHLFGALAILVVIPPPLSFVVLAGFGTAYFFWNKRNEGPYAYGNVPIIGYALELYEHPQVLLPKLRKELGDVFTLQFFGKFLTVVYGYEDVRTVLCAPEKVISLRGGFDGALDAFIPDGASDRYLNNVQYVIRASVNERMEKHIANMKRTVFDWFDELESRADASGWTEINVFKEMDEIVLKIGIRCFPGKEFAERHTEEFVKMWDSLDPERALSPGAGLSKVGALLWKWPGGTSKLDKTFERFLEMIEPIVRDRMAAGSQEDDFLQMVIRDFMQQAADEGRDEHDVDMWSIMTSLWAILLAAQTNSYATTGWVVSHAATKADVKKKLDDEIEETLKEVHGKNFLGLGRRHLETMRYLRSCIRETVRLYTSGLAFRKLREPMVFNGHTLPAGRLIGVHASFVSKSKEAGFENGNVWDPMRHYTDEVKKALGGGYIFGSGTHPCPGARFATNQVSVLVSQLLHYYDLEHVSGETVPDGHLGATERAKDDVILRVKRKPGMNVPGADAVRAVF